MATKQFNRTVEAINVLLDKLDGLPVAPMAKKGTIMNPSYLPEDAKEGDVYLVLYSDSDNTKSVNALYYKTASNWEILANKSYTTGEVDDMLESKQDSLTTAQLSAINSGITSADVEQITENENNILSIKEKTDNITIDSNRNIYIQATEPTGTISVGSTWISGGTIKGYAQESNISTATIEQGTFNADGSESPNNNRVRTTFDTNIYTKGSYTVSITGAINVLMFVYDSNKTCIQSEGSGGWKALPYSFELTGDRYVRFAFRKKNDADIFPSDVSNYALAFQGWKQEIKR